MHACAHVQMHTLANIQPENIMPLLIQQMYAVKPSYSYVTVSNKKDVDAECRHDMRPSIALQSISGTDSKLSLTTCVLVMWHFLEVFDVQ